jgi:DNA-binding CsgD family transcriptional regulator
VVRPTADGCSVEVFAAALDAALAHIAQEAFLLDPEGAIVHANGIGWSRLGASGDAVRAQLAECLLRPTPPFQRSEVRIAREAPHILAFVPRVSCDCAAVAARRWSLTNRQAQVLARLVAGDSNKEIAFALACSRRAVEHHITALLRRTSTRSRAELLARLYAEQTTAESAALAALWPLARGSAP